MTDLSVGMCCGSFVIGAVLFWHAWRDTVRARAAEMHSHVQQELLDRQNALEKRLCATIDDCLAKVHSLDVAATAEFKAMKSEFNKLSAKEGVHAFVNQAAATGKMF